MKRVLGIAVVIALVATNVSMAGVLGANANTTVRSLDSSAITDSALPRAGEICAFSFDHLNSMDDFFTLFPYTGSPFNDVVMIDAAACIGLPTGTPVTVTGIGWTVSFDTVGASWLREAAFDLNDSSNSDPGELAFRWTPGTGAPYNAPGHFDGAQPIFKFADNELFDITLEDGVAQLAFFETYDDVPGGVDADYLPGSVFYLQVTPEPATIGLLALGAVALIRRRR